ncbi:hypothetical protein PsorP6_001167 [Peronosclerospora sorghi]|uniref:Uncharacterized protein n=1 Tax=Peronosclerospora sorghi TaxID=230839 RepID=A0ACC0WRV5_9STRA|nr:hypothetical protein PsorP6_001167 [Peronosclerospora sorghi]
MMHVSNANLAFVDVQTLSPAFHAKILRLYADLMLAKREFKRAIRYYRHSCRDMGVVTNEEELETKLKVARYYVQLDSIHEAIQVVRLNVQLLLANYIWKGLMD